MELTEQNKNINEGLGRITDKLSSTIPAARGDSVARPFHAIEFEKLRLAAKLSPDGAAEMLGVSVRTISRYERGESRAPLIAVRWLRELIDRASSERSSSKPSHNFTFIDLFAGIGGLRRPFENIGGKCVFTCEYDDFCRETYSANFDIDHEFGRDIRDYAQEPSKVPPHDVLLAGFPCQPFSIAGVSKKNALGRPHGFLCDTQGTLFFDLAQILERHKPHAFLLENVKNLENHDQGRTFATIVNVLTNELKYELHHRVISSEPWVPQKRQRIFLVGFRNPSKFSFNDLTVPEGQGPKLGSILQAPSEVDPKYTLTAHLWNYLREYKKKHNLKGNGFGYSLFGPDEVTRTLSARYFKDGSEILVKQEGGRPRRLTPRECSRLMGFDLPQGTPFNIVVSDTQAYRQFGNAVVVPVAQAVANAMKSHIESAVIAASQPKVKYG